MFCFYHMRLLMHSSMSLWYTYFPSTDENKKENLKDMISKGEAYFIENANFIEFKPNACISIYDESQTKRLLVAKSSFLRCTNNNKDNRGGAIHFDSLHCIQTNICSSNCSAPETGSHSATYVKDNECKNNIYESALTGFEAEKEIQTLHFWYGNVAISKLNYSYNNNLFYVVTHSITLVNFTTTIQGLTNSSRKLLHHQLGNHTITQTIFVENVCIFAGAIRNTPVTVKDSYFISNNFAGGDRVTYVNCSHSSNVNEETLGENAGFVLDFKDLKYDDCHLQEQKKCSNFPDVYQRLNVFKMRLR